MKTTLRLLTLACLLVAANPSHAYQKSSTDSEESPSVELQENNLSNPLVEADVVFQERDGLVAVEAEHFSDQTLTDIRAFHLTNSNDVPEFEWDGDPPHVAGASNGGYLEILPDNRRNHGEKLIAGENFSNKPGKLCVLHYKVNFENPGRYYVWVRAYSTGSEDNGLHVGLNGQWPESGQRLQWCKGKRTWRWDSMQRTAEVHCGVPHQIFLDIEEAGEHTIQFSMREDGFEFDKWLMTKDRELVRPEGLGPDSISNTEQLPKFEYIELPRKSDSIEPQPAPNNKIH